MTSPIMPLGRTAPPINQCRVTKAASGGQTKPERQAPEDPEPRSMNRRIAHPLPAQQAQMDGQQENADAKNLQQEVRPDCAVAT